MERPQLVAALRWHRQCVTRSCCLYRLAGAFSPLGFLAQELNNGAGSGRRRYRVRPRNGCRSPGAPRVVVEFTDFECPYCGEFARLILPGLRKELVDSGQVTWVINQMPLVRIHRSAYAAALTAVCAARLGNFWATHDRLFANPVTWSERGLRDVRAMSGLDNWRGRACLTFQAGRIIDDDLAEARSLGLTQTPSFVIGRPIQNSRIEIIQILSGLHDANALKRAIGALTP